MTITDFAVDQVIRVVDRSTGRPLWDAVVVRIFKSWIGLRPEPRKEGENPINMNLEAYEMFPVDSPQYRYVRTGK